MIFKCDHSCCEKENNSKESIDNFEQNSCHWPIPSCKHLQQSSDREQPDDLPKVQVILINNVLINDYLKSYQDSWYDGHVSDESILI